MAFEIKTDQNTPVEDINTITNPNTKTLIDRYVFASNFCKDKRVLDCASGWGYGSQILKALGANYVMSADIDSDAITYIRQSVYSNIEFSTKTSAKYLDVTTDWFNDPINSGIEKSFDVVVSIETFEHVPRETVPQMLLNFKNACKQNGTIIITTPQRFTPEFKYVEGSTHLYEYTLNEFYEELSKVFTNIKFYYAVEFRHPASNELNTVFTDNAEWSNRAPVMIAVITND